MLSPRLPPPVRGTSASIGALKVIEAAVDRGLDARTLCDAAAVDLQVCQRSEARIPYEWQVGLWEQAMRLLRDPSFPVFVATRFRPGTYDVPAFVCMTQPNLGAALRQGVRYTRIWTTTASWDFAVGPDETVMTLHLDGGGHGSESRLGVRCISESSLIELVFGGRGLTGVFWSPREVRFSHARPRDSSAIESALEAPVKFSCAKTELVLDSSVMALPVLKADPDLAAFFEKQADALLARCVDAEPDSVGLRLRAALAEELRSGVPTLDSASARLGIGARTLRRRLQEESTTFHDVLDETRSELARLYIGAPKLAIGEVAFLLGFSEPSAFHRAFKRWTGMTPLAYRKNVGPSIG